MTVEGVQYLSRIPIPAEGEDDPEAVILVGLVSDQVAALRFDGRK